MSMDRVPVVAFALGAVFVFLKAAGAVAWPWWVVLAPAWGFAALIVLLAVAIVVTTAIGQFSDRS